jgi:6-phosphogluconolactonase
MRNKNPMLLALLALMSCDTEPQVTHENIAVGTYTRMEGHVSGDAQGIYLGRLNTQTGQITIQDTIYGVVNPSYIQVKNQKVYAVSEVANGTTNPIGKLHIIDLKSKKQQVVMVDGDAPCHVNISDNGEYAIISNYLSKVSLVHLMNEPKLSGAVTVEGDTQGPPRQEAPHPHMSVYAPDGETILVTDLGLDVIIHYRLNDGGLKELTRTNITAKAGPRHMEKDHTHRIVYVLNELNHSIESLQWIDASTPMSKLGSISTLKEGIVNPNVNCSAIHMHPTRKYLYAANRGINGDPEQSISAFKVIKPGQLELIDTYPSQGLIPRDFTISPDGQYLLVANQESDNIVTYRIKQDGSLISTDHIIDVRTPVCLKFY